MPPRRGRRGDPAASSDDVPTPPRRITRASTKKASSSAAAAESDGEVVGNHEKKPNDNEDESYDSGEEEDEEEDEDEEKAGEDEEEPEELLCPILRVMMRDPVFVAGSGNTYERSAIERFWSQSTRPAGIGGIGGGEPLRDPLTNAVCTNCSLFTNWDKRREVQTWLARHPGSIPEGWTSRDDVRPPAEEGADDDDGDGGVNPRWRWAARRWRRRRGGGGGGGGGGRAGLLFLEEPAACAAVGVGAVAALAAVFVACTSPAPGGWDPGSSLVINGVNNGDGGGGNYVPRGAHFLGRTGERSQTKKSKYSKKAAAEEAAAVARFGRNLYESMTRVRSPAGSRVVARKGPRGALEIVIPPAGILNAHSFAEMGFAAVWTTFTAAWTYGAARSPSPVFALFSLPFWGVGVHLGRTTASTALETTRLAIIPPGRSPGWGGVDEEKTKTSKTNDSAEKEKEKKKKTGAVSKAEGGVVIVDGDEIEEKDGRGVSGGGRFYVSWEALGRILGTAEGPLDDVSGAEIITHAYVNGVPVTGLVLREGIRSHAVGRGLHQAEQEFVARLVRGALRDANKDRTKTTTTTKKTKSGTDDGGDDGFEAEEDITSDTKLNGGYGDAPILLSRL